MGNPSLSKVHKYNAKHTCDKFFQIGNSLFIAFNLTFQLDTVSRVLMDRHWSVGDLAAATLRFALHIIEEKAEGRNTLFEEIIGMDKPSP